MDENSSEFEAFVSLQQVVASINHACAVFMIYVHSLLEGCIDDRDVIARGPNPFQFQIEHINRLVRGEETHCVSQLRMDRRTFMHLCLRLQNVGLTNSRHVTLKEKIAMFLSVLAHHKKNRTAGFNFRRSGQTVSKHFNDVLRGVLRLHGELLATPNPVSSDSTDGRWKYFENCLGALDGTYIRVHVCKADAPRYRTRKGQLATNVLGVCSQDMKFIYVLPGWEGSVADSRVLRDAVTRADGLKVPNGYYYLVDVGYTNGNGFLAPYRSQRYHLSLWREGGSPRSAKEFFNMKHSSARNVIERCFGLLKLRWAILRSPSFYPIRTQSRIITACCLLHNHIRKSMNNDPMDDEYDLQVPIAPPLAEPIDTIEPSNEWTDWRDEIANNMYNNWLATRGGID